MLRKWHRLFTKGKIAPAHMLQLVFLDPILVFGQNNVLGSGVGFNFKKKWCSISDYLELTVNRLTGALFRVIYESVAGKCHTLHGTGVGYNCVTNLRCNFC